MGNQRSVSGVGGFPHFMPPKKSQKGLYYLNSARSCLYCLLKAIKPKTVYFPKFVCSSFLSYSLELDIDFRFYSIDENFLPLVSKRAVSDSNSLIIYVNYFGICSAQAEYVINKFNSQRVIIDNSQSYSFKKENALATIYSPRKFFPLSDSGMIFSDIKVEVPNEFGSINLSHFDKKSRGFHDAAYTDFLACEDMLANAGPLALSDYSLRLLQSFLGDRKSLSIREIFFKELDERFGSINLLKGKFDNSSQKFPLCYPLQLSPAIHTSTLVEKRVFAAIYWPNLANTDLNTFELSLIKETVNLPLSNIYDQRDFEYLIETVSSLINS
jgi:hypothetical protein